MHESPEVDKTALAPTVPAAEVDRPRLFISSVTDYAISIG